MKHRYVFGILGTVFVSVLAVVQILTSVASAAPSASWVSSDTISVNGTNYTNCEKNNNCSIPVTANEYFPDGWTKVSGKAGQPASYCSAMPSSNIGKSVVTIDISKGTGLIRQVVKTYTYKSTDTRGKSTTVSACFGVLAPDGKSKNDGPNDGTFKLPDQPTLRASFVDSATITIGSDVYTDLKTDSDYAFINPSGATLSGSANSQCKAQYAIKDFSSDKSTARRYTVATSTTGGLSGAGSCVLTKEAPVQISATERASLSYTWASPTAITYAYGDGKVFTRSDQASTQLTYTADSCTVTLTVANADYTKDTTGTFRASWTGSTSSAGGVNANTASNHCLKDNYGYTTDPVQIAANSAANTVASAAVGAACDATKQDCSGGDVADTCPLKSDESMRWLGCSIFFSLQRAADTVAKILSEYLYADPNVMFGSAAQSAATIFRNIGMVLIVVAGLVMVISQALGFEFLDAYNIRKLMPRLGISLIGMALAWPLLKLAVTLTNDLGGLVYTVLLDIPKQAGLISSASQADIGTRIGGLLTGVGAAGGAVVAATLLGAVGLLSLLGTVLLSLLTGLLVLAVRQLVIFMAILLAPLAIAAYVLPGGQKLWKFWKDTLITTLIMYPLIMGFIGAGAAMSYLIGAAAK